MVEVEDAVLVQQEPPIPSNRLVDPGIARLQGAQEQEIDRVQMRAPVSRLCGEPEQVEDPGDVAKVANERLELGLEAAAPEELGGYPSPPRSRRFPGRPQPRPSSHPGRAGE